MAPNSLVIFFHALGIFQGGFSALIQTERAVMAAAGDQVCLQCQLTVPKEVHQVTWQKVLPDGERNVATCSMFTGQRVNPGFQGKVEFKDGGLQNSSIVIRQVTEQDEGCYRCLFNTYSDGALMSSTCLTLYELHGPFLQVRQSNTSEEAIVSCSATAHPAPTVTLRALNHTLSSSNKSHENKNGTVTVNATAVLQRPTEVECEVQVSPAAPKKVFETIPEIQQAQAHRIEEDTGSSFHVLIGIIVLSVTVIILGVLVFVRQRHCKRRENKDLEGDKTPARPSGQQTTSPLLQELDVASEVRRRTPFKKKAENESPHLAVKDPEGGKTPARSAGQQTTSPLLQVLNVASELRRQTPFKKKAENESPPSVNRSCKQNLNSRFSAINSPMTPGKI